MRRGAFVLLTAVCVAYLTSGCATTSPVENRDGASKPAALRVGITPDYPPIIFKRNGQIVGVEADLARELAAALGRPLVFVALKWEDQIPALAAGKIDIIMSGMSITRARQVRVEFCQPYLRNGLMAAVPSSDLGSFRTRDDVLGFGGSIGVVKGTTGEAFVRRSFPDARIVPIDESGDAAVYLTGRRIKMFIHDAYAIVWLVSENEVDHGGVWIPLTDEQLAWAVRRDDPGLRKAVNNILAKWRSSGGTLDRILDRWIPRRDEMQWPEE